MAPVQFGPSWSAPAVENIGSYIWLLGTILVGKFIMQPWIYHETTVYKHFVIHIKYNCYKQEALE